mgnify:FL=1
MNSPGSPQVYALFLATFIAPGTGQAYKGRWRRAGVLLAGAFAWLILAPIVWIKILPFLGLEIPRVSVGGPPLQLMAPSYFYYLLALGAAADALRLPAPEPAPGSFLKAAAFFIFGSFLIFVGPTLLVFSLQALSRP